MSHDNLDHYANDFLNPERGFVLLHGFFSSDEMDTYREECATFLARGPRVHARINRPDMYDYVHPKLVRDNGKMSKAIGPDKVANIHRIYQFLHNRHSSSTRSIHSRALSFRNQIERQWEHDETYRRTREALMDYIQVTRYVEESRGFPKHRDCELDLAFPLLQCLVLMSEPGKDFEGGELLLYPRSGGEIRLNEEWGFSKGDVLYFDKSLFHRVDPTKPSPGSQVGRWTAVIGGRDLPRGRYLDRFRYHSWYMEGFEPRMKALQKLARRRLRKLGLR